MGRMYVSLCVRLCVCVCVCVCLCVFVYVRCGIDFNDLAAADTRNWFGHAHFPFNNGLDALTCGVFFNWTWQSKMHCSLHS